MPEYILSLDQGTTSSRAILFDKGQNIVGISQKEFTQLYPREGWVEHDPMEIYSSQYAVMMEVIAQSGIDAKEIAAAGIANQRETTVLWDKKTGRPIHNAIVWQCRRTADIADKLKEQGLSDYIRETTGLVPDAYFSGTKIKWILDHVKGARERAKRGEILFGTVDSWLIWKLTGGEAHVTDRTNASRTMLYDIHALDWDQKLLDILDIPREILPRVGSSSEIYGYLDAGGAKIPIAGGAVIQWIRDEMKLINESRDAEYYAGKVADTGGVYLVPAFTGLGAPHWDAYARGCIIGITRGTKREHIIRAAQESIAFQSMELLEAMEKDTKVALRELNVDGGASRDAFLMQFQADILGKKIRRPMIRETTALGAAYLAGLAVGVWKSTGELKKLWKCGAEFIPDMEEPERRRLSHGWRKAVERSRGWAE